MRCLSKVRDRFEETVGSNKFKDLESVTNPDRAELLEAYNKVTKKVT